MAFAVGEASSSSSSSSTRRSRTYNVFLSFRGEDTRKGFTDHLFASLERKGITAFRDDKDLERGEVISDELLKAIEGSIFAIVVLSPNYAFSTWCLDELQKIVECSNNLGLVVLPIFYGVDPSDLRRQRGSFAEAFRKHEEKQDSQKIERWREALRQVASYSGWDSKDQHEATLVESIAQHIHRKLIPKLPSCTENLVGIASRVEEVNTLIGMGLNDVRFIGIWGMGGIGKTTIARAVYEATQGKFEATCFLANVREVSKTNGLLSIQKELLSRFNISTGDFYDLYDGRKTINNYLCNKKVLLVLDDVSEISQLENLAGNQDWFGPGSRVIITTRDMHLLRIHGVLERIYKVEGLVQDEALHLFCLKAFKQDQPEERYRALSQEVVKYSRGLPLALEVLGSYLYGRTIDSWHSAIKKINSIPHAKILDTLKISYESLDYMEKNMFLDIACFFKGMNRDEVVGILEKCGYNSRIQIDVLIERSLVTLNQKGNTLDMHDLLQEMGRNIVFQESPNDPGKRSRLWTKKDIDFVLTNDKGTEAIQGIFLRTRSSGYKARWGTEAFLKTSQLKLLRLRGIKLPLGLNYLPSSLKVLHWTEYPLKTLPLTDQQYEVVEIKLWCSKIEQLWQGTKILEKLKRLDLSYSSKLRWMPDLSAVPILEALVLKYCSGLTEVHPSLVRHKNLVLLNLKGCIGLKTLPGKLEMSSLKELILTDCWKFENLPEFGECMKHLSRLSLKGMAIEKLPTSLGYLVGLSDLNLELCKELVCLPDTIHGLKSLKTLNASNCLNLRRLPPFISSLLFLISLDLSYCHLDDQSFPHDSCPFPSLTELDLSGNDFVNVPVSIHKLPKLRCMWLNRCTNLQVLPELPSSITELQAWCCSLNTAEFNPLTVMYSVFVSPNKDHGKVFNMVISGWEIPSWFVHREDGSSVSVPHDCPLNERLGLAFCFCLQKWRASYPLIPNFLSVLHGNRLITGMEFSEIDLGGHLYILFLTNDDFSDKIYQDKRFELSSSIGYDYGFDILSSSARWVRKQDIEDLNKSIEQQQEA